MTLPTPERYEITKWEEDLTKGVFTASVDYTLQASIVSDVFNMAPSRVAALFNLPVEGTNYAALNALFPRATCRSVKCKQIKGGVYLYQTKWSDESSTSDDQATDEDPILDLPVIKPLGMQRERAITRDRDDKMILNAAGDPVEQSVDDNLIGFNIKANVALNSNVELLVLSLRNRVNNAPIRVRNWFIGTNMARVVFGQNFLSDTLRRNDIEYLEFSFELLIDERDLHRGTPLNAGFREKIELLDDAQSPPVSFDPPQYRIQTILNSDDGSEVAEPAPLDEDGKKIAVPTPDNAVFLEIDKYEEGDFTQLPGVIAWVP